MFSDCFDKKNAKVIIPEDLQRIILRDPIIMAFLASQGDTTGPRHAERAALNQIQVRECQAQVI